MSELLLLNKKIDEILEKNNYLEKQVETLKKTVDQHEYKIQELLLLLRKTNSSNGGSSASITNNTIINSPPLSPRTSIELLKSDILNTINNSNNNNNNNNNNNSTLLPISEVSNEITPTPTPTTTTTSSNNTSPTLSPISSPQLNSKPRIQFLGNREKSNSNLFKKEDSSESLLKYSKDGGDTLYIAPTTPRPSKSPSMDFIASTTSINSTSSSSSPSIDNNSNNENNNINNNNSITTNENNIILETTNETLPNLPDNKCQWAIVWEYSAIEDEWYKGLIAVEIESKPFAKGALRNAYQLKVRSNSMKIYNHFSAPIHEKYQEGKKINIKEIPKLNQAIYVAKDSKTARGVSYNRYFEDVKMQMVCKSYGERYNSNNPPKKIEFLSAWVIEIQGNNNTSSNRSSQSNSLYGLELFMKGEFKKQNSNYGSVLSDRNTPQAFSHFTYECTGHDMLVVDIQGVDDIYTDPEIHTKDGKGFGFGNLGKTGIDKFLGSHKCNPICLQFGLPSIGLIGGARNAHRVIRGTMLLPDLTPDLYEPEYPKFEKLPNNPLNSELVAITNLCGHEERVCSLLINFDKSKLYSASADGWVRVWDLTIEAGIQQINSFRAHRKSIEKMVLSDKYLFTASSDGIIKVWSLPPSSSPSSTYECLFKLEEHSADVNDLCIDIENNFLVSCSFDKTIKIWDLETMKCVKSVNAHGKSIKSIYVSGKYLFSASNDQSIKIWDLEMMMCVYGMNDSHDDSISSLRMFGNRLFSAGKCEIKEWDISTFLPTTILDENTSPITDILVIGNGYLFVSSDDCTIKIIDLNNLNGVDSESMKIIYSIKAHRSGVSSLATDGKRLFSGGCDNVIKVWNWKDK